MLQAVEVTHDFNSFGDRWEDEIQEPDYIVDGLIYANGLHSIYAPSGKGKTILALWIALQAVRQKKRVAYVDEENGFNHIKRLLAALGMTQDEAFWFQYAQSPGFTSKDIRRWHRNLDTLQPDLVVFDPFADMLALDGLNENSSTDVTGWVRNFAQPVKDMGKAVLILDHTSKDGSSNGARGSTAKPAKLDVAWKLERKMNFNRDTIGKVVLTQDKDRIGYMPFKQSFTVGGDGNGNLVCEFAGTDWVEKPRKLTGNTLIAYDALNDGMRATDWLKASGLVEATFYRKVNELVDDWGYVEKQGDNYYHTLKSLSQE
jgi:RecA-family ATPase